MSIDMESSTTDSIWNRACFGGGEHPLEGDRHLAALLRLHGPAMNGGLMHGVEIRSELELREALRGFEYLGLAEVSALVVKASKMLGESEPPEDLAAELEHEYFRLADDSVLFDQFEKMYRMNPSHFGPITPDNDG